MKKLIALFAFLCFTLLSNAQEIADNSIGLRFGNNNGFGAEISYQRALGDINRLEANLGWENDHNTNAFKITGLYQWIWNLSGDFNWYAGAGGGLGSWRTKYNDGNGNRITANGTFFYAAGNVGIEYHFPDFPILLSLDTRPEFNFNNDYNDGLNFGFGFGVRYKF